MGIAEIVPAHTFNFSRDDAVYWRKDTDDECPRISQIGAQEYLLPVIVFPFLAGKHAAHSSSDPFPMQCVHILQSPSTYFQSLYRGAVPAKIYTQICTWAGHGECNRQSHFRFLYQAVRIQGCLFSLVPDAVRRRPSQYCQTSGLQCHSRVSQLCTQA